MKNEEIPLKEECRKNRQFRKILAIIRSCKNTVHVDNCRVILKNFWKIHRDEELYSILNIELKLKYMQVL